MYVPAGEAPNIAIAARQGEGEGEGEKEKTAKAQACVAGIPFFSTSGWHR